MRTRYSSCCPGIAAGLVLRILHQDNHNQTCLVPASMCKFGVGWSGRGAEEATLERADGLRGMKTRGSWVSEGLGDKERLYRQSAMRVGYLGQ